MFRLIVLILHCLSTLPQIAAQMIPTYKDFWVLNNEDRLIISEKNFQINDIDDKFDKKYGWTKAYHLYTDQKVRTIRRKQDAEQIFTYSMNSNFFTFYNSYFDHINITKHYLKSYAYDFDSPSIDQAAISQKERIKFPFKNFKKVKIDEHARKEKTEIQILRYSTDYDSGAILFQHVFDYRHFGFYNEIIRTISFIPKFLNGYVVVFARYGPVKKAHSMSVKDLIIKLPAVFEDFPETEGLTSAKSIARIVGAKPVNFFLYRKFRLEYLDFDVFFHYNYFTESLLPKDIQLKSLSKSIREAFVVLLGRYQQNYNQDLTQYKSVAVLEHLVKHLRVSHVPKSGKVGFGKDMKECYFLVEFFSFKMLIRLLKDEYFLTEIVHFNSEGSITNFLLDYNPKALCYTKRKYGLYYQSFKKFKRFEQYFNERRRVNLICLELQRAYKLYIWTDLNAAREIQELESNPIKSRNLGKAPPLRSRTQDLGAPDELDVDQDLLFGEKPVQKPRSQTVDLRINKVVRPEQVVVKGQAESRTDDNPAQGILGGVKNDQYFDEAISLSNSSFSADETTMKMGASHNIEEANKHKVSFAEKDSHESEQESEFLNIRDIFEGEFIDGQFANMGKMQKIEKVFNFRQRQPEPVDAKGVETANKKQRFEVQFKILDHQMRNLSKTFKMTVAGVNLERWCRTLQFFESKDFHWIVCLNLRANVEIYVCNKYKQSQFEYFYSIGFCARTLAHNRAWAIWELNRLIFNCVSEIVFVEKNLRFMELGMNLAPEAKVSKMKDVIRQIGLMRKIEPDSETETVTAKFEKPRLGSFKKNDHMELKKLENDQKVTGKKNYQVRLNLWSKRKWVVDVLYRNNLCMADLVPGKTESQSFVSFYEPVYLSVKRFVKGNLIEANVLELESVSPLKVDTSHQEPGLANSSVPKFGNFREFTYLKFYGFESRFYFGDIDGIFGYTFRDNLKFNDFGELKKMLFDTMIVNEDQLAYFKPSWQVTLRDAIQSAPTVNQLPKTLRTLSPKKQKELDFEIVSEKGNVRVQFSSIRRSIFEMFNNYRALKVSDNDFSKRAHKFQGELTGLRPVFQKHIKSRVLCKQGWIYKTEKQERSFYIYHGFDEKFRMLPELRHCKRVVYLGRTETLLCHVGSQLQLFNFQNENRAPNRLRFFYQDRKYGLDRDVLETLSLYQFNMGKFHYVTFHTRKPYSTRLRLVFCNLGSEKYFELYQVRQIVLDLGNKLLQRFFIRHNRLVLVFKQSVEVYYLNVSLGKTILLKRNYYQDLNIFPDFEKDVLLVNSFSSPGSENRGSKEMALAFLAKQLPMIVDHKGVGAGDQKDSDERAKASVVTQNSTPEETKAIETNVVSRLKSGNVFRKRQTGISLKTRLKVKNLWKLYYLKHKEQKRRGELGLLIYNIQEASISSFKSFIPLRSLYKKNVKSSLLLDKKFMAKKLSMDDVMFFEPFHIIQKENSIDHLKQKSGLLLLLKVEDWAKRDSSAQETAKGDSQRAPSQDERVLADSNYMNKYSLKILFPLEPTIKIDLISKKYSEKTDKLLQFMAVPGQGMQKMGGADNEINEESQAFKNRERVEKNLEQHYKQQMEKMATKKKIDDLHRFKDDIYYQVSHRFVNKLSYNNMLFQVWSKIGQIEKVVERLSNSQRDQSQSAIKETRDIIEQHFDGYQDLLKQKVHSQVVNSLKSFPKYEDSRRTAKSMWANLQKSINGTSQKTSNQILKNAIQEIKKKAENKPPKQESLMASFFLDDSEFEKKSLSMVTNRPESITRSVFGTEHLSEFVIGLGWLIKPFWSTNSRRIDADAETDFSQKTFGFNEQFKLSVKDYQYLRSQMVMDHLIPDTFQQISDSSHTTVLKLDIDDYFKGNIMKVDLLMEFFPDNYHPLVRLTPFFKVVERHRFSNIVNDIITKQILKDGVSVFKGHGKDQFVVVSKKSINIFKNNTAIQTIPKTLLFFGNREDLSVYLKNWCLLRMLSGLNIIFHVCFEESLLSMDRRHSSEDIDDSERRRKKVIFVHKFGHVKILQSSLASFINILMSIDFDDFVLWDQKLVFFKKDFYLNKLVTGDIHIRDFKIERNKRNELVILSNAQADLAGFYFKVAVEFGVLDKNDRLEVRIPHKNTENSLKLDIVYTKISDEHNQVSRSFFTIKNLVIISHINQNFEKVQLKIGAVSNASASLEILLVVPDQTVYVFSVPRRRLTRVTSFNDLIYDVAVCKFQSQTHGIDSGDIRFAEFIDSENLVVASRFRSDSAFSLFYFAGFEECSTLLKLNLHPNSYPKKKFAKFQKIFENKLLAAVFKDYLSYDMRSIFRFVRMQFVFSDEIIVADLAMDYILDINKSPFKSDLIFLRVSNHVNQLVLPLNIADYKKFDHKILKNENHSKLFFLFVFACTLGFGFINIDFIDSLLNRKKYSKKLRK